MIADNRTGTPKHRVIGIVSWGYECALPHIPGYYAPVYPQRTWIEKVMKETNSCPNEDKRRKDSLAACAAQKLVVNLSACYLMFLCLVSKKCYFKPTYSCLVPFIY